MDKKRIEVVRMKVKDIKEEFGNPRKIKRKKREDLKQSLENLGDFGLIVIDEKNNVIAGNQRISIMKEQNPETEVLCKRLVGYSNAELRAINIKANTHAGDWDLEILADWTSDLSIDLGIDKDAKNADEIKIREMEPIRYEMYDYVMIVCRNEVDYKELQRALGLEKAKTVFGGGKYKIKGRAVWYDEMKAQIVRKTEVETND